MYICICVYTHNHIRIVLVSYIRTSIHMLTVANACGHAIGNVNHSVASAFTCNSCYYVVLQESCRCKAGSCPASSGSCPQPTWDRRILLRTISTYDACVCVCVVHMVFAAYI